MLHLKKRDEMIELSDGEVRVIISSLKTSLEQCKDYKPKNIKEEEYVNEKIIVIEKLLDNLEI